MKCKLNYKGKCNGARSLRTEVTYLSQRQHWENFSGIHNVVRRIANAAPISAEQSRTNQIAVVRKNNYRIIAQYCRPQDTALRDAMAAYEIEAAKELPPA